MLPPHIIDELRRREEWKKERRTEQPRIELPFAPPRPHAPTAPAEERGVTVIELF